MFKIAAFETQELSQVLLDSKKDLKFYKYNHVTWYKSIGMKKVWMFCLFFAFSDIVISTDSVTLNYITNEIC